MKERRINAKNRMNKNWIEKTENEKDSKNRIENRGKRRKDKKIKSD